MSSLPCSGWLTRIFSSCESVARPPIGYGARALFVTMNEALRCPAKSMIRSARSPGAISNAVIGTGARSSPPSAPICVNGNSRPLFSSANWRL